MKKNNVRYAIIPLLGVLLLYLTGCAREEIDPDEQPNVILIEDELYQKAGPAEREFAETCMPMGQLSSETEDTEKRFPWERVVNMVADVYQDGEDVFLVTDNWCLRYEKVSDETNGE